MGTLIRKSIGRRISEAGDAAVQAGVYEEWRQVIRTDEPNGPGPLRYQAKLPGEPWGPELTPGEAVCVFTHAAEDGDA